MSHESDWSVGRIGPVSLFGRIGLIGLIRLIRPIRPTLCVIVLVAVCLTVLAVAPAARAQNRTTSADLHAAVDLASSQGICTGQKQNDADCVRTLYTCKSDQWASFISSHVDFCGPIVCKADKKSDVQIPQGVVNYLNKDVQNRSRIPTFEVAECFCDCSANDTQDPCSGIPAGTPFRVKSGELLTREECDAICSPRQADRNKCAGHIAPVETVDSGTTAGQTTAAATSKAEALQMTCFSQDDCAKQKGVYDATVGGCRGGKGLCYAQAPAITLNVPLGSVTVVQGFEDYVVTAYRYLLSVLVVVTTIMFIYGAFRYLVGASIGGVQRGKQIMFDAVVGMLLVLSATTILRTINPALTNLNPLKVYMVNTAQYISSVYCKDLPKGLKLADAGQTGKTMAREDVDKASNPYTIASDAATCGRSYYVQGATGNACEGSVCAEKGKACVSCIAKQFSECNGVAGSYSVCAKMTFGGNIHYADSRYPDEIWLVLACGYAKNPSNLNTIKNNVDNVFKANVDKGAAPGTGDASAAGTAAFKVDIDIRKVNQFVSDHCTGGGNSFLGGFLAVKYHDTVVTYNDYAVVAKSKCIGGGGRLSGYADGTVSNITGDSTGIAAAYKCAITNPPNSDFENPSSAYWSLDELTKASSGDTPIVCNFNLDNTISPSNPAQKGFCGAAAPATPPTPIVSSCPSGTTSGTPCSISGDKCTLNGQTCTCTSGNYRCQ